MPTGTDSESDVTADDAMRKVEQSDKVALVGGTARAADTEYDEIERALGEVSKVVNKVLNKALQDCGEALEIYNGLLAVMKEEKTPKEYGEYLQKKRQGKRRYK